jgi:hypothetical protein
LGNGVQKGKSVKTTDGLRTVILNWKKGDNDPFTVFNEAIRHHFEGCGRIVEIVEITDEGWAGQLAELALQGIDFVFTWQGLGSDVVIDVNGRQESLWNVLKVPLICLHGDHPSHNPEKHRCESRYCFHLYPEAEFARYSNRHFRRMRGAAVIDFPILHIEPPMQPLADDCFVIAKNLMDPMVFEQRWLQDHDQALYEVFMAVAEVLTHRIASERYVDVHAAIDQLIDEYDLERIRPEIDEKLYHQFHSEQEMYCRNYKSLSVVVALRDFPVRIYGRGWERIAKEAPANLAFKPGLDMVQSQALFHTRYGIIDVSPAKSPHDRTLRAMANSGAFLTNACLEDMFADIARYAPLFYSLNSDQLADRCAAVMADPEGHRELARQFANVYHDRTHYKEFVFKLTLLANSVARQ